MKQHADMGTVVRYVKGNVGKRVRIMENKGRNRVDVAEGVITNIYPCLFTIRLDDSSPAINKEISYTYTDVFTRDVELELCS
ncbi:MAG: Veg family protein [Lachnospiraceae bacterium]|nr:Veg family protein [Lachnospiraceae bacterium]